MSNTSPLTVIVLSASAARMFPATIKPATTIATLNATNVFIDFLLFDCSVPIRISPPTILSLLSTILPDSSSRLLLAPFPEQINCGVDQQLHQERCEQSAHHRGGNPFHHVRAAPD